MIQYKINLEGWLVAVSALSALQKYPIRFAWAAGVERYLKGRKEIE